MRGHIRHIIILLVLFISTQGISQEHILNDRMINSGQIDYLIISSAELAPEFLPLMEWKIRKGLRSEIVLLEDIEQNIDEATIQLKIKRYLYERYVNDGLKWVLLGGDHDIIPVQACYSFVSNGNIEIEDYSIPTDLFYACFDNRFDWNAILDDKIGQAHRDGQDLIPEIYLSRISVRTPEQVRAIVNKTLNYELYQPENNFAEKMLLTGVQTWSQWDGKSDSHHRSELMYSAYISEHWSGNMLRFFDTGTDFKNGRNFDVTTGNLSELLNSGFGFFHFSGHGSTRELVLEGGSKFNISDASALSNPFSGIFLANSCDLNAFDSIDPCFSEALLRNPDGGGVAFFGSSRYGFANPEATLPLGPSMKFNAHFAEHLYGDSPENPWKSFAAVAAATKNDFVYSSDRSYLYLLYAINPMGDPELPIYTSNPGIFNKVRIYQMGNSMTVNTGLSTKSRICVSSLDLDEGYYQVVEDLPFYTFEDIPEACQITITAPNFRPYVRLIGSTSAQNNAIESYAKLYPNPVRDYLQVELKSSKGMLSIYSLEGRLLRSLELNFGSNQVNMADFPGGAYLLHLSSESKTGWHKVLKD